MGEWRSRRTKASQNYVAASAAAFDLSSLATSLGYGGYKSYQSAIRAQALAEAGAPPQLVEASVAATIKQIIFPTEVNAFTGEPLPGEQVKFVIDEESVLKLQGTAQESLSGDFRGLSGQSVETLLSRIPKTWKVSLQNDKLGVRFIDDSNIERIRIKIGNIKAPPGTVGNSGWHYRVHFVDANGVSPEDTYLADDGRAILGKFLPETHLPLDVNPALKGK